MKGSTLKFITDECHLLKRRSASTRSGKRPPAAAAAAGAPRQKLTGPVGDGECYFWRTTGCSFGTACKYKHIAANKAIDQKPRRR